MVQSTLLRIATDHSRSVQRMKLRIGKSIISICREIQKSGWTEEQWEEAECDDWFQYNEIVGGYDADERAFLFSYYEPEGEWWFRFSLSDVPKILNGKIDYLTLRIPDRY